MKKLYVFFVLFVVALTTVVRLYKINEPVADWHSFRQVDTASVAQFFVRNGIDILHPRYHDLSNIQSGKDNPKGWRMVELPLYQATAAVFFYGFPSWSVDIWLRLVTIASAAGTSLLIMLLVSSAMNPFTGILAGATYAILPYSIFYGRTILPETFAVFWATLSVYVAYRITLVKKGDWWLLLVASMAGAIALLVKPTAGFLLLPVPYFIFRRYGFSINLFVRLIVYSVVCLAPFLWWRGWIAQFPEGIPVFEWLFNKGNIRFKGAWFQWLFAERVGKLMLGYWGLIPFGLGLIIPNGKKEGWFTHLLGFGGLLYLSVFAAGNVQHDYYQIILLPVVSIYVAKGFAFLWTEKTFSAISRWSLSIVCLLFMFAFSWYTMRSFYWINRPEIIEAGGAADRLLPKNAKVIAPYNGDTTFLYQTKRQGWPLGFDIDEKITMGATHYVTVSPTDNDFETMELAQKYTVLVRNDTYAIIDLTKPKLP